MPVRTRSLFANFKEDLCGAFLEFAGTFVFLSLAFGASQAIASAGSVGPPPPNTLNFFVGSISGGFSLLVAAWLFYRVTGSLFNPNITLALFLTGNIGFVRFVLFCIAQLAGATAASAVILALTPGPCSFNVQLQEGINPAQGVFIEMFITCYLILAVLMLAVEKHQATPFAPVGIGLTLFVNLLWSAYYTGGGANTARAFGPAAVTGFPYDRHWVYWVGPCLGSFLAASFYTIIKHWDYTVINPGQSTTNPKMSPPDPILTIRQAFGKSPIEHSRTENPRQHYERSGSEVRGETPVNRKGVSQDDLV